jgi:uncharacterized protein YcbK (DUF882 family)
LRKEGGKMNFNITENFTFYELTNSKGHPELVQKNREWLLGDPIKLVNLVTHCFKVVQPIRDHFGGRVGCTSGYRYPVLNDAVGGHEASDHMLALATDLRVWDYPKFAEDMKEVYEHISAGFLFIEWKQLIYYPDRGIIHISSSMEKDGNKKQYFIKRG